MIVQSYKDLELTLSKRGEYRKTGILTFVIASLILLDSPFYFPIPFVGIWSVLFSSSIYLVSFYQIYRGIKLPKTELLQFVNLSGGIVKKEAVFQFFKGEIDEKSYSRLVNYFENLDYLSLPHHDMDYVQTHEIIPENQLHLTKKGMDFLDAKK